MTGNGCAKRWLNSRSSPLACSPAGCRKTSRTPLKPSAFPFFPQEAMTSRPTARVLTGQTPASILPPCTCSWVRSSTATRFSSSVCGAWIARTCWARSFRQSAQTIEGPPLAPEPLPEDPETFWDQPVTGVGRRRPRGPERRPRCTPLCPGSWVDSRSGRENKTWWLPWRRIYAAASQQATGADLNQAET